MTDSDYQNIIDFHQDTMAAILEGLRVHPAVARKYLTKAKFEECQRQGRFRRVPEQDAPVLVPLKLAPGCPKFTYEPKSPRFTKLGLKNEAI